MKTETKLLINNLAISQPHNPSKFSDSTPIEGFANYVVVFASGSMFFLNHADHVDGLPLINQVITFGFDLDLYLDLHLDLNLHICCCKYANQHNATTKKVLRTV